jgi:hypothetical protein
MYATRRIKLCQLQNDFVKELTTMTHFGGFLAHGLTWSNRSVAPHPGEPRVRMLRRWSSGVGQQLAGK